jgi:hypothetical protein
MYPDRLDKDGLCGKSDATENPVILVNANGCEVRDE